MKKATQSNPLLEKTFDFSLSIIKFTETLEEIRRFNLANQLFKSGTSIGANAREAQSSESLQDFIHKLKIAAKEAEETEYWLLLCKLSKSYPFDEELMTALNEIQRILSSIINTSKKTLNAKSKK
jgi:four helix bundle protein